ncbi:MAG TPA: sigma-70 family RNA polymerase sigma factor [Desulfocapsa sulfexigens]|nr:sigma-70 family RNA polymerase sigma factor [Desulfocapsa sulfexigens]
MNLSKLPNTDLHQMCLRGDESAWAYIYNYALCISRSPRWRLRESPEDTAQGIVCHLLGKGIDQVRDPNTFRGFVRSVAINFIRDSFKKRELQCSSLDSRCNDDNHHGLDPKSHAPGPEELVLENSLLQVIDKGLASLSEQCRTSLTGYIDYKMGFYKSYAALAKEFEIGVGTLSSRVTRCLDQLRQVKTIQGWMEA